MSGRRRLVERVDRVDRAVIGWMATYGHFIERIGLAIVFLWFGLLKIVGHVTGSTIIGQTIYLNEPAVMVPVLGVWDTLIGLCFLFRPLLRGAIFLLAIRLLFSLATLLLTPADCFAQFPLVPTGQGQYLIKEIALFGAAMIIGSTVRLEPGKGHWL